MNTATHETAKNQPRIPKPIAPETAIVAIDVFGRRSQIEGSTITLSKFQQPSQEQMRKSAKVRSSLGW